MDNRISKKEYWDNIYKDLNVCDTNISLDNYWEKKIFFLLKKYFIKDFNKKFVEIGGAPGNYAILFKNFFQYNSYALDYSESGIEKTKENFRNTGIDENNAIFGDFLDKAFLSKYRYYFDVVFSAGFIEHFKNPSHILQSHLEILKKGGSLIIMMPSYNFIFRLEPFFGEKIIEQHNLSFMNIREFKKTIFDNKNIEITYLGYLGGINFSLLIYKNFFVRKLMHGMQRAIEIIGLESLIPMNRYTSPYLICIAKKIA